MADNDSQLKYWAFISYNHKDKRHAQKLHRRIETYRIPKNLVGRPLSDGTLIPRHLRPIFRDRDELSSGPDLTQRIKDALGRSRSLVVLCSPSACASRYVESEIREFQGLGRNQHIMPAIAERGRHGSIEDSLPQILRRDIEPLAADIVEDGFTNATLKVVAGILGVGFDELKRRHSIRGRKRFFLTSIIILLSALGYVMLADNGAPFVFAASVNHWLDQHELSVFRHVSSEPAFVKEVAELRSGMISDTVAELQDQITLTPDGHVGGTWPLGEIVAGIADAPEATPADLANAKYWIEFIFQQAHPTESQGVSYGWLSYKLRNPQAEASLWPVIAVCALLKRPGALSLSERQRFIDHLHYAQRSASLYYTPAGGWDHLPNQQPPQPYALYTTLDALETLLAVHDAGQIWSDTKGHNRLPDMIRATSNYLISIYDNKGEWKTYPGWHGTQEAHEVSPRAPLTLKAYYLLLKAARSEPRLVWLPAYIRSDIANSVKDLARVSASAFATEEDHLRANFITPGGKKVSGGYDWKIEWLPAAIACAKGWMDDLRERHAQNADVVAVRRVLERLVEQAPTIAATRKDFYRAEILYYLDFIQ